MKTIVKDFSVQKNSKKAKLNTDPQFALSTWCDNTIPAYTSNKLATHTFKHLQLNKDYVFANFMKK